MDRTSSTIEAENVEWADIPFGRDFLVNPVTEAIDPHNQREDLFTKVGEFEGVSYQTGEIVIFEPSKGYTLIR